MKKKMNDATQFAQGFCNKWQNRKAQFNMSVDIEFS